MLGLLLTMSLASAGDGVSVSDPAILMLSFLGVAPAFTDERMAFQFGLGPPPLSSLHTELFSELPGGPGDIAYRRWSISPYVALTGRFAVGLASLDLSLPQRTTLNDGSAFGAEFVQVQVMYHSGPNLLFFLPERSPIAVSVGPMLDTSIGPFLTLAHPDGVSEVTFGRLGQVRLAPAVGTAFLWDWFSFSAMGGVVPSGGPWTMVDVTTGEADGVYGGAAPDDPQSVDEASDSLARLRTRSALLATAHASVNLYQANEPFLTLGARVEYRRSVYEAREQAWGHSGDFVDRDVRLVIGVGIGVP